MIHFTVDGVEVERVIVQLLQGIVERRVIASYGALSGGSEKHGTS